MVVEKKWIVCNGEGHWAILVNGKVVEHCDESELNEAMTRITNDK